MTVQRGLAKQGRRASTVNLKLQDFKSAIRAAYEQGLIERNVGAPVRALPTIDSEIRAAFSPQEIEQLIAHAKPDWKGAILIGAHTDLRLSNITELDWRDVNLFRAEFVLKPVKQRRGKRDVMVVPMSSSVQAYFRDWNISKTRQGPVFKSLAGRGVAGHSTTFNNLMSKAGILKEIELPGGDVGRRSFHSLRHFYVSQMANQNVPEDVRRTLSAHKGGDVHRIYVHYERDVLRGAIDTLPPLNVA